MYHHHPYSYHRSFTVTPNSSISYLLTGQTAAINNSIGIVNAATTTATTTNTPSPQRGHVIQLPSNATNPAIHHHYTLNPNSSISAASYSTGEKTNSSYAPTHLSAKTPYNFLTPPSICAVINNTVDGGGAGVAVPVTATVSPSTNQTQQSQQQQQPSDTNVVATSSSNSNNGGCPSNSSQNSNSKKLKTEPLLTQFHQAERFTFANMYVVWNENHWKRVVFQDERKFNLDGPDGFSYYFHDLRNFDGTLSQRPRGNSVYIYMIITSGGPAYIDISTSKRKVQKCIELVMREKSNIASLLGGDSNFILQDHNWIGSALPSAQEWLTTEGIKTQKWPTIAHDLNIMENIWGWLIREVFDGGRKFSRKDDLIGRIHESWSRLPADLITNLYSTMPERITELYCTRGIYTNC